MKNLNTLPEFATANKTLGELRAALSKAQSEESRILGELSRTPGASRNPLDAALALLGGTKPSRTDIAGLQQALDAVRLTIATLVAGIVAQEAVVATLRNDLSALVCQEAQEAHGKAAQRIADALVALDQALRAEVDLRAEIEGEGYRCTLEAMQCPALSFEPGSVINSFLARTKDYASDVFDLAEGTLDRPTNVRVLFAGDHGAVGDIVTLDGRAARALQRLGHAEPTKLRAHKQPQRKPWDDSREVVFA